MKPISETTARTFKNEVMAKTAGGYITSAEAAGYLGFATPKAFLNAVAASAQWPRTETSP